ncbi:MAG: ATP-grasp fold amidoligase family protein, partial [Candidatus Woesearchaeota archaeon]
DIDSIWDNVILKAVENNPSERFADAGEMLAMFENLSTLEQTNTPPEQTSHPGAQEQSGRNISADNIPAKRSQKHFVRWIAASIVVTLLIISGIIISVQDHKQQLITDYLKAEKQYEDKISEHKELLKEHGGEKWEEMLAKISSPSVSINNPREGKKAYDKASITIFDDINFNQLPEKFVLKCTHDSGGVVICKNKNNFNIKKARKKIKHCLKRNYFYNTREWPYKNVRPRVIAEKYIGNDIEKGLKDYKIMCFNGVAKCSLVCSNRNTEEGVHITFYDNDWNIMPFKRSYSKQQKAEKCPSNFNEMKEIAEYLAKEMPFARIDFYEDNDKIYFGEITLYPGSGFKKFVPESYDLVLGSWLDLSHEKFDKELR